jgi:hypothetical protein
MGCGEPLKTVINHKRQNKQQADKEHKVIDGQARKTADLPR